MDAELVESDGADMDVDEEEEDGGVSETDRLCKASRAANYAREPATGYVLPITITQTCFTCPVCYFTYPSHASFVHHVGVSHKHL